jgi:hypothetical protein
MCLEKIAGKCTSAAAGDIGPKAASAVSKNEAGSIFNMSISVRHQNDRVASVTLVENLGLESATRG